ncbi:formate dehydrogenase [Ramlibacter rhizophilus]|uniref:Formate dehydrogenase n=1 Tax=Ramlibacter rhizophilus TaxID=1781167 RepID=A0A4Z0BST8_9BURK|nr:formate dehydrogenase [Ramlibacter rhizophilus]TFZ01524.1 formate dehydrogenase [Ramlibacter rhizophilus]
MSQPNQRQLSRRTLFAGAGTVGAAAAAVTLLPTVRVEAPTAPEQKQPPARGGGYHLSEHVRRYFKTTLI